MHRHLAQAVFSAICLAGVALAQEVPKKSQPPEILDPVTKRANPPLPAIPVETEHLPLPLPLAGSAPEEMEGFENLLLPDARSSDLLPPIIPLPDEQPVTVEDIIIRGIGSKVVASVLSIRVWDAFGGQLAHGVGFYVTDNGMVLTDTGLVHPEFAEKIDYITLTSADGTNQKVEGFFTADLVSGVTLLKAEVRSSIPLKLRPAVDLANSTPCHVVAVSEKRGLVLAAAKIQQDPAITGLGWHPVKGDESPGAVGSPVLDSNGQVIAIVGMKVPLKSWMNFALTTERAAFELQRRRGALQPLTALPKAPTIVSVARSTAFLDAFETLQAKRVDAALPKLIRLTTQYPRSAECWALLGLAAAHLGGAVEAVNCQRKAVSLDPKAGLYWHQLALAKLRDKSIVAPNSTEDREALELATQQRPDDSLAWLLLASRYVRDSDLGKANDALNKLILLAPDYAQAHYLMAYVQGKRRDYQGAEQSIRRALNLNSRSPDAWYYQGLLSDKQGDLDTAIKAYRTTVRLKPTHSRAWMNLAHALKKAGKATEAREAFLEHQKHTTPAR